MKYIKVIDEVERRIKVANRCLLDEVFIDREDFHGIAVGESSHDGRPRIHVDRVVNRILGDHQTWMENCVDDQMRAAERSISNLIYPTIN